MEDLKSEGEFLAYFNIDFDDFKQIFSYSQDEYGRFAGIEQMIDDMSQLRISECFEGYLE